MTALLSIESISKRFGETLAVSSVSFDLQQGEIFALLGPSGCGKSTILALIAGLLQPDSGDIAWQGRSLLNVPTHQRNFGLMFQDYALFPHLSVQENVAFGLHLAGKSASEVMLRTREVLSLVGLSDLARRDVGSLSGGEQQRVALARSLAPRPRLLMLDEPLGALDRTLREHLVQELGRILRATGQTAIYVTHDQEEAFALADRLAVMQAGKIEQAGAPQQVYLQPANPFVARFVGLNNLLPGTASAHNGETLVQTAIGNFRLPGSARGPVTLLLRPNAIRPDPGDDCQLTGRVEALSYHGSSYRLTIIIQTSQLSFELPASANIPAPGEMVCLWLDSVHGLQLLPQA